MVPLPSSDFLTASLSPFISATMSEGNILRETMTFAKNDQLLGSREAAFLAFVGTTKAAAFLAAPDGCIAALWAWEFYCAFAWQYHASAPVARGHSNRANFSQHRRPRVEVPVRIICLRTNHLRHCDRLTSPLVISR